MARKLIRRITEVEYLDTDDNEQPKGALDGTTPDGDDAEDEDSEPESDDDDDAG